MKSVIVLYLAHIAINIWLMCLSGSCHLQFQIFTYWHSCRKIIWYSPGRNQEKIFLLVYLQHVELFWSVTLYFVY